MLKISNITKSFGKLCEFFLKKLVKKFAQFKNLYYFCNVFSAPRLGAYAMRP